MKVKELFKSTAVSHSIKGLTEFLDRDNCQIINKTKGANFVLLQLKRKSDGEEGHAYLRVKDEFKNSTSEFLRWAFVSEKMMGLTLNQLDNLETNLEPRNIK
jgi:hypothetical protein